jgi:hypothetical protein
VIIVCVWRPTGEVLLMGEEETEKIVKREEE